MALLGVVWGGVEVSNRIFVDCIGGGEASGWSGLSTALLWDWTVWQETA
jgi:hypothetical protein